MKLFDISIIYLFQQLKKLTVMSINNNQAKRLFCGKVKGKNPIIYLGPIKGCILFFIILMPDETI